MRRFRYYIWTTDDKMVGPFPSVKEAWQWGEKYVGMWQDIVSHTDLKRRKCLKTLEVVSPDEYTP
jgi:hypothetical protein